MASDPDSPAPADRRQFLQHVRRQPVYEFSPALTLKGGVQFKPYEFETTNCGARTVRRPTSKPSSRSASRACRFADYSNIVNLNGLGAPSGTTLRWLVPNVRQAGELLNLYDRTLFPMGPEPSLGNNQEVAEDDAGGFVQLDFNTELDGLRLRGNVGVRYVQTDVEATGYSFTGGQSVKITAKNDYDNVLPSLNLVVDVTDDFLVRMAYARVMTRPGLGSLAPSTTISVSGNNRTVTSGNPGLDPYGGRVRPVGRVVLRRGFAALAGILL